MDGKANESLRTQMLLSMPACGYLTFILARRASQQEEPLVLPPPLGLCRSLLRHVGLNGTTAIVLFPVSYSVVVNLLPLLILFGRALSKTVA